jgi:hypothetical protein
VILSFEIKTLELFFKGKREMIPKPFYPPLFRTYGKLHKRRKKRVVEYRD